MNNENIVGFLKQKADFISGTEMANALKITRAAVWKRIKHLRKNGYTIESSPSKGYKLIKTPDLSIEEIKDSLTDTTKIIGREIIFYDSLVSTNITATELAERGYADGTVVISDCQTGGKGRLERKWLSPPGKNLYMSIILRPEILPRNASMLTIISAVSSAIAIRRLSNIHVSIKWPNDIMVSEKKLGGILTEMKADMDRLHHAIIGIGVNINMDISDMPDDIKQIATSLKNETKTSLSRTELAIEILKELDKWYSILLKTYKGKEDIGIIIKEWSRLSSTIGQKVKVTAVNKVFTGIAEGIDEDGYLILKLSNNSLKKISAGDVQHLRRG
ncbi:MAG: biotin--[acetyl-CoA-carboxylase] ligase [Thermodesulfovibrionales bacterium]|nr:biotin--[acetyl-CoA-carboxylase] ligase [Thermodesulfovibrionales bacterium]